MLTNRHAFVQACIPNPCITRPYSPYIHACTDEYLHASIHTICHNTDGWHVENVNPKLYRESKMPRCSESLLSPVTGAGQNLLAFADFSSMPQQADSVLLWHLITRLAKSSKMPRTDAKRWLNFQSAG